jgi:hypothetical protein
MAKYGQNKNESTTVTLQKSPHKIKKKAVSINIFI